jgi:thioredoxin 2
MSASVVACRSCGAKNRLPEAVSGRPACAKCHADLPWLVNATDADLVASLNTSELVLVDLWAPWCGPCRAVAPILEKLSAEFAGKLKVVKVDVDGSPNAARQFGASSIPMMVFTRKGKLLETVVGAQPEHVLRAKVLTHLTV